MTRIENLTALTIAAAVLGGCSLRDGVGSVIGIIMHGIAWNCWA
jgi:ABC-type xylose transport system permease subunit